MPDRRTRIGTPEWRAAFEERLARRARFARLGHIRSVSPGPPRFVDGNLAFYLHDGRHHLAWMLSAIESARVRIDLEIYIFEPDEAGKKVLAALVRAAERGVFVRLLYDSVGSGNAGPAFFEPLRKAGGRVIEFNPVAPWRLRMGRVGRMQHWEPNRRDHRKLLVCDAPHTWATQEPTRDSEPSPQELGDDRSSAVRCTIAITGGRNIGDEYLSHPLGEGQWRDCGVVLIGPVGVALGKLFDAMWFHAEGPDDVAPPLASLVCGEYSVMPIGSQPGFINLLQWTLSRLALATREELRISCAYFIPSTRWRRALGGIAKRAKCRILIPKESDVRAVDAATRHLLGGLLRAGVSVYRYAKEILHEKTLIYDRVLTVLGSSNLDPRSFDLNYELSVLVVGERFAQPVVRWHDQDLKESEPYTLDEWRARPPLRRFVDWLWSLVRSQL